MHDDARRGQFLLELGGDLESVSDWLRETGLDRNVDLERAPTFLHGGSSAGRWVVMGINPGADEQSGVAEEKFKRGSQAQYLAFHDDFFEHFPRLRRNAKQPWWRKLYRVTRALHGEVSASIPVPWDELRKSATFVVQDLLPFHGRTSATLPRDFGTGPLSRVADATIEGIAKSSARGVLVCSRAGYRLFRDHKRALGHREFTLSGRTKTNKRREIAGYVARLGAAPLVALDNEVIAQPTFPFEQLLPQLVEELDRARLL